jgi:glutathione S-transferase
MENTLKLFYSAASPFVRKCVVTALELDISERIERVPAAANPVNGDRALAAQNPLGKVPTLITDDGTVLFDSRVICEYLNDLAGGELLPRRGAERWRTLVEQSLADGISDAAVLARYETAMRPEGLRWNDWTNGQLGKIRSGLAMLDARAADFGDRVDFGTIAFGCALGYLDFRFASLAWRDTHPNAAAWFEWFGGRDSMVATRPPPA